MPMTMLASTQIMIATCIQIQKGDTGWMVGVPAMRPR
jgi:hypothetical protein